jgi:hypothetical protein
VASSLLSDSSPDENSSMPLYLNTFSTDSTVWLTSTTQGEVSGEAPGSATCYTASDILRVRWLASEHSRCHAQATYSWT